MAALSMIPRAEAPPSSSQTTPSTSASPSSASTSQADRNGITSVDTQTGIGIGIAIAVSIILLILGILWLFICRRKRRDRRQHHQPADNQCERGTFDSFDSTLVSSRHSIPLQDLHEKDGKSVRRGSEMMTLANSHEASALPPTRDGHPAEMPTIWNEGYRGRRGSQIRRDSELTLRVSEDPPSERPGSEATKRSEVTGRTADDARYTFLID